MSSPSAGEEVTLVMSFVDGHRLSSEFWGIRYGIPLANSTYLGAPRE